MSLSPGTNIESDERQVLGNIFIHLISQRFKNLTIQEILKMIAQLTPIEETQVGKELIEKGLEQGEEKIIITQAKARFADFSDQHEAKIRALKSPQLEALALELLNFESIADLENWLKTL
jgi:hypothetical protein